MANQINTRIIHKHDTEANWNKATSFIPKKGEIIIYDRDDNYTYERIKIGDGVTAAPSLPFATKNAFGNVKVGSTTITADSFSDTLTLTAGANISLTPNTSGDSVTIAATDTTYNPATQTTAGLMSGADKTNLDNLVDAIQDKVDKVSGKGLSTNDYTTAEKTKLEGIETGANKTIVDSTLSSTSGNPVQNKVINSALSNKVDKVTGKALSTNDFDNESKSKLDGIETGAEVNQNAFSTIAVKTSSTATASNIAADAKSDTFTIVGGSNITLTPDTTNDTLTIAAKDTTYSAAGTSLGLVKTGGDVTISSGTITVNDDSHNHIISNVDGLQNALDAKLATADLQVTVSGTGNAVTSAAYDSSTKTITLTKGATYNNYSLPAAGTSLGGVKTGGDVSISSGVITINDDSHNHVISNVDGLQNALDSLAEEATTAEAGLMSAEDKAKLDGIAVGANNYSLPTASNSTLGGVKTTSTVTSTSGLTPTPIINGVPYYKNSTYNLGSFGVTATKDELNILDGVTATTTEINYLDGVSSNIQNQLDGKVNVVEGKGLSTNDYTTTEKDKLFNIAPGAEVNQNAFSNVVIGSTTIAAETETDTLTLVAGSNITLTPDATNDKITISATDTKLALDTALTSSGKAADAKAAGDRIKSLEDQVLGIKKVVDIAVEDPADETINSISEIIGYIEDNEDAISIITNKQDKITGAATTIASSDLTANRALISNSSGKVAASNITATELNYLDGATSNIQDQITNLADTKASTAVATTSANGLMSSTDKSKLDGIATGANKTTVDSSLSSTSTNPVQNKVVNSALSGKQATITGAATTITGTNLTANRALISNGSGKVAISAITSTELECLDGIASNVQSQLDAKASKDVATTSANGLMSATDKKRIDTVSGASHLGGFGNKTIADLQTALDTWLNDYYNIANASVTFSANPSWLDYWNQKDTTSLLSAGGYWTATIIAYSSSGNYTQLRFSQYEDKRVYYACKYNNSWMDIHRVALKDDLTLSALGVTATAAELNKLDGVTATTAELNYVDGVTSSIQSQLDGKAPTSHASTATTYGAASADNYGHAKASKTTPKANGTAAVGSETSSFARGDHIHPLQTSVSGSAGSLATTRYIDGVSFNGSANVTRYATCSTAAATAAKTASITAGTFSLVTGARVTVKFTYANSVANPTLNIGSTGAKAIYWHGAALASSQYWQAGAVLDFVYNGTQWDLIGIAKDNNSTYTVNNATITISPGTGLKTGGNFTTNQSSAETITIDHSNSVTAGTVSEGGSARTLAFGGTFKIPSVTYDAQGHITGTTTTTLTMPANPNTNTTYTLSGAADGNTWKTTLTPSSGSATTSTVPAMGAATSSTAGTAGLVPAPAAGKQTSFLRGDGTWVIPTNTTYNSMTGATSSAAGSTGLVPAPAAGKQSSFLRGDGTWAVPTNTTYSAGNGLFLTSTTFNIGEGTGISVDANAVGLATVDTVTAGTYGPSAAVTGNNNTTMNVPEITVDAYGRVTNITNRVYTAKNSTYTIPTSLKSPYALTVQGNGTNSFTYDGSAAKTLNIKPGTNITVTSDTSGNITIGNSYSYSLPTATTSVKGGVIVGSNITVSSGTISLTKDNVTTALGYTPPTSNTTYSAAKYNTLGLVKPAYTSTGAATLTTTAASNTTTPTIAAKTTTSDRYYAVEADKNGVLFVNVPWSDTNTTYTLSGLGGIGTITASGTAPLTLSATKSGTSVTISGSVATASSSLGVVKTTSTVTSTSGLTACPIISGVVYYKDTNTTYAAMTGATSSAAGTSGLVPAPASGKQSSFLRGDGTWVVPTDNKVTQTVVDVNGDGYVVYSTSNSDTTTGVNKNLAIRIRNNVGTTSATGESAIILGNSTASGTADNKQGRLYIYSSNTGYHVLETSSTTSNPTHILPTTGGTLLNSGNYTSYTVKKDGTGASGDWNINAATASTWKTARTLTIGAKAQSVNGSANVSWSLYDILKVGTIGNDTSWEITDPGVYHVSGSTFTGSGNPEAANGGLAPYRYGQLIVSKGGPTGGLAEFYISHADSKPDATQYGIKFRTGWNGAYQTTWRTLVDNVNISNFAISTNGGTLTGGNLIIDRGTAEPKYAFYRTVSDVVHRGLLNLNSIGAVKLGYYDADWGELNYIILGSNATTLGKPLAVGSGGTGATTPAAALTNLGGVGYTVVSDISSLL